MSNSDQEEKFKEFGKFVSREKLLMKERVIAFLYYRAKINENDKGASVEELIDDFKRLGLSIPIASRVRDTLKKDRRTISIGKDKWKLKNDELQWLDTDLGKFTIGTPTRVSHKKSTTATCSDYFTQYKLHPLIEKVSRKQFINGDYKGAIQNAFVEVVEHVKRKTSYPKDKNKRDLDGDPLMNVVFGCDNGNTPLIQFNPLITDLDKSEQRGLMYLYKGIVGIRNKKAHLNFTQKSDAKTLEYLALASLLLRLIDENTK